MSVTATSLCMVGINVPSPDAHTASCFMLSPKKFFSVGKYARIDVVMQIIFYYTARVIKNDARTLYYEYVYRR
jgi:hypothetical protein